MKKIITPLACCMLMMQSITTNAQVDLQNNGTLYISTGSDILYINGALVNANTAALTNNGALYVRLGLTNNQASMATGTGTLYLNGTALQTVAGSQVFKTFNLNTDNTAGITLNNNLSVSGLHTFANGVIATSATPNYLVYEAGSSHTGSTNARHVTGWVKKFGNTNFTFPVGNGTYMRDININNLSATSEFNGRYLASTPNIYNVQNPIAIVDPNEYWEITRTSGGSAQVLMNWENTEVPFPFDNTTFTRATNQIGGLWTDVGGPATGDPNTTGTVSSAPVSSFGLFTFGSYGFLIGVDILSVTAQRVNGKTVVQWKTENETQIDHYEVLRSNNATDFGKSGSVKANNKAGVNVYEFTDVLPLTGKAWYRIKSVDINGKVKYSTIVVVSEGSRNDALYVMNNPVANNIFLSAGSSYKGSYQYTLINAAGQLMQSGKIDIKDAGIVSIPLSSKIANGICYLRVFNQAHQLSEKIFVQQ